jgi:ABC-type microcin C transport system permease subunit YejE
MIPNSNATDPEARNSPWLGIVKFLFIVVLIIIIFLLGQDMVRHRFFQGGWVDQNDTVRP